MYPKAVTGKPRISYNDAVEEALCFGWIDSTVRSLDDEHTMQRFTPRKPGSTFSQPNIERLKWLDHHDLIHPEIRPSVLPVIHRAFVFPGDILDAIRADPPAWEFYQTLPDGYRRIRIAYVDAARKRPEEFDKRLAHFIRQSGQHKLIRGYGGIDKYY